MQVRHGQVKATEHVLADVKRPKVSLHHRAGNLSVEGVFIHPASQQAALKVERGIGQGDRGHGAHPVDKVTKQAICDCGKRSVEVVNLLS
jgi:hypothetical protein